MKRSAVGSTPTARENEIFHAWLRYGSTTVAAERLGCSSPNVSLALRRLCQRLNVAHSLELVGPLVITPYLGRIRRLERLNRQLKRLLAEELGHAPEDHRRVADGGTHVRRQRRRRRRSRRTARHLGVPLTIDRLAPTA